MRGSKRYAWGRVWAIGYLMVVHTASAFLCNPTFLTSVLAWFLILAGGVVIVIGIMVLKWHAVAPSVKDTLDANETYSFVRHPLYSGMLLELIGLFIYIPTIPVLVACGMGGMWVVVQAKLEKMDLVQRLADYGEYVGEVPWFMPRRNQASV